MKVPRHKYLCSITSGAGSRRSKRRRKGLLFIIIDVELSECAPPPLPAGGAKPSALSGDSDDDGEPNTYDYNDSFIDNNDAGIIHVCCFILLLAL